MKKLQKIIDSKSLENSQKNIMMEFDLVKLQFCNLNMLLYPKHHHEFFPGEHWNGLAVSKVSLEKTVYIVPDLYKVAPLQ